ncbi:MAG: hypothetical protein HZB44_05325 [Actinobacteria bacterium]|nr:hypothetical protein [Actinomycetota bacterium]
MNSMTDEKPYEPDVLLGVSAKGWASLGGGFAAALIVSLLPFLQYVFSFFSILVHEMGHALSGWLFGYPSIPSFDFYYGGGVTLHQNRLIFLAGAVLLLFAILGFMVRESNAKLLLVAAGAAAYAFLAFTLWHEVLIIALGHGTELIIAGIFIYRAASGSAILQKAERPVYAFIGFLIIVQNLMFNYRLITSTTFRFEYEYAKGGMEMDYSRLAYEYLHLSLASVATLFLVMTIATPFISLGVNMAQRLRD